MGAYMLPFVEWYPLTSCNITIALLILPSLIWEIVALSGGSCRVDRYTVSRGGSQRKRRRFHSALPNVLPPQSLLQVREGIQEGIAGRWGSIAEVTIGCRQICRQNEKSYLRSIGTAWASEQKEMKLGMEASRVTCCCHDTHTAHHDDIMPSWVTKHGLILLFWGRSFTFFLMHTHCLVSDLTCLIHKKIICQTRGS